jgi:mRNA-degrading endonuclease RelE of RelBE toxin-antitoxin system
MMITVIETQQFIKKASHLMTAAERAELIDLVANDPEGGDIIPRTGGVRKLRVQAKGRGKSGGYRVIYYFYNENNPVLLFTVYGKNERSDLTRKEENELYTIIQAIKKEMRP